MKTLSLALLIFLLVNIVTNFEINDFLVDFFSQQNVSIIASFCWSFGTFINNTAIYLHHFKIVPLQISLKILQLEFVPLKIQNKLLLTAIFRQR